LKGVEVQNEDSSWAAYPSIGCLMEVGDNNKFLTIALIRLTREKEIRVSSSNKAQDLMLMYAAQIAGIPTAIV
jgi:hypothetical protein